MTKTNKKSVSKKLITLKSVSINQHGVRIPMEILPASDSGKYTASDKGSKNVKRANITRRKIFNAKKLKHTEQALYIRKNQVYKIVRKIGDTTWLATTRVGAKTAVIKNHDAHRNVPKIKV